MVVVGAGLGIAYCCRYAKKRSSGTTVTDGLTGGPKPLLNCFLHRMRDDEPAVKAALRTKLMLLEQTPAANNNKEPLLIGEHTAL